MPCWPQDTRPYTHQYPNHISARSPFTFPSFYVDRELVEFMPIDEQEYDEVIEEYEEEILVQEGALEPVGADLTDRRLPKASPGA